MSDATAANQKTILANQAGILKNQKAILAAASVMPFGTYPLSMSCALV